MKWHRTEVQSKMIINTSAECELRFKSLQPHSETIECWTDVCYRVDK